MIVEKSGQKLRLTRTIVIVVIFLIVFGGGLWYFTQNQDAYAAYRETTGEKTEGDKQEKIRDEELPASFLFYPKFDIKDLDDAILAKVSEAESEMKDEVIVKMDYTSNLVLDQYINVKLTTYIYENDLEISQTQTYFSYDKVHNKILGISDVLRGNYVSALSILAKDITYTKDSMGLFQIGEDGLMIFDEGKEKVFAYEDIKDYMQLDNEAIPRNAPANVNTAQEHVVDPNKPMVAFTFDDGPNRSTTTRILDAFDAVGGRATFFMLGNRAAQDLEMVKEVCRRGFEAANHSYTHQNLASNDTAFIHKEIFDTQDVIFNACGVESKFVRPPYGAINENLENASDLPLILWNVDTEDWKNRDVATIKSRINASIRDGSIILLHDIYDFSASAMEEILTDLHGQGYQFVSISELMKYRPDEFK